MEQMCPASPAVSSSSTSSVARPSTDTDEIQQPDSKSRKCKRGKQEGTNALLKKMVKLQESSDKMMYMLEERQMELDAQLRHKEREFQLQMIQMLTQQNTTPSATTTSATLWTTTLLV